MFSSRPRCRMGETLVIYLNVSSPVKPTVLHNEDNRALPPEPSGILARAALRRIPEEHRFDGFRQQRPLAARNNYRLVAESSKALEQVAVRKAGHAAAIAPLTARCYDANASFHVALGTALSFVPSEIFTIVPPNDSTETTAEANSRSTLSATGLS